MSVCVCVCVCGGRRGCDNIYIRRWLCGLESLTKLSALEKLCVGGNQIPDLESLDPLNKL